MSGNPYEVNPHHPPPYPQQPPPAYPPAPYPPPSYAQQPPPAYPPAPYPQQPYPQQPYPPGWGPYPPVPPPGLPPHAEPQPYHRLLRTRDYSWWRPLLGLLVAIPVYLVGLVLAFIPWLAVEWDALIAAEQPEELVAQLTPTLLLSTNLSLAAAIPAAMLGTLVAGLRPGWLASVTGRLRWGLLGRCLLLALAVVVLFGVLGLLLPTDGGGVAPVGTVSFAEWGAFAVVVLLTTPLQAAGEEYAFRGLGFQVLGAWVRTPWLGAVVTSLLFALAHGGQNPALFLDRFAFGLVACWLVVRTGGLEAAIALHTVNNVVTFLVAAAFDQTDDALLVSDIPWTLAALDIAQMVVFALLVDRLARRREVATVTPYAAAALSGPPSWRPPAAIG